MNGFRNRSRSSKVWCWQRAGGRAVILEVSGRWIEAAEAWIRAAHIAPRTDWQQFAWQRQNTASGAAGIRPDIHRVLQEVVDVRRKSKNIHVRWADAFALLSCPTPETGKSKFSPLLAFRYYLVNGICHIYKHNVNNIN